MIYSEAAIKIRVKVVKFKRTYKRDRTVLHLIKKQINRQQPVQKSIKFMHGYHTMIVPADSSVSNHPAPLAILFHKPSNLTLKPLP